MTADVRSTTRSTARPAKRRPAAVRNVPIALLFIAPAALGFLVFTVWPAIRGIYLSFTDYSVFTPAEWSGLENYQRMVQDDVFWHSMAVTVYYVLVNIGVQTLLALLLAVLMHRLTQSVLLRGIMLTPYLVSNVVAALVWMLLLDYQLGIVNEILDALGVGRQFFFGSQSAVIPTIALVNVWRHLGYTSLLIFAGLQTIPPQLYEAARVDGAGMLRTFASIVLPLSLPGFVVTIIWQFTSAWNDFLFAMFLSDTSGGPVSLALNNLAQGAQLANYGTAMAGALLASLPTLLVYIILGKYFIGGLMSGSVK